VRAGFSTPRKIGRAAPRGKAGQNPRAADYSPRQHTASHENASPLIAHDFFRLKIFPAPKKHRKRKNRKALFLCALCASLRPPGLNPRNPRNPQPVVKSIHR
jgi:hypothetical protein